MELQLLNFEQQYILFQENIDNLNNRIVAATDEQERDRLAQIHCEYHSLDVKMRLAFGIREIRLNNYFVNDKHNSLKLCHLLYYKLADLWFAYEAYFRCYAIVFVTSKNKINWLDSTIHDRYRNSNPIINAIAELNQSFTTIYSNQARRIFLIEYLQYSVHSPLTSASQKRNIDSAILQIQNNNFILSHTQILSMIYAIRNNFVHNGETTVIPVRFRYEDKAQLLQVFYSYLTLITITSSNITFENI